MKILAIETSCDDTSLAVFEDDKLIAMETKSQLKVHEVTHWIVPEVAAREHANNIFTVLDWVLEKAKITPKDIDYIWVTTHPGLISSLLTGTSLASTLSAFLKIPIIPINHIKAHIFSNFLEREESEIMYPLVCLTVSWGHNEMYYLKDMWSFEKIWESWDDAAWEAFDKVATMLWLPYIWWPHIAKLADEYESKQNKKSDPIFPRVLLDRKKFDFSFSWLKSAVKREVDNRKSRSKNWELTQSDKEEIAYEFQNSVVEVLVFKLTHATEKYNVKTMMISWWVSANDKLRNLLTSYAKENNLNFIFPKKKVYSMDNAAMVWMYTYYKIKYGKFEKKIGVVAP